MNFSSSFTTLVSSDRVFWIQMNLENCSVLTVFTYLDWKFKHE